MTLAVSHPVKAARLPPLDKFLKEGFRYGASRRDDRLCRRWPYLNAPRGRVRGDRELTRARTKGLKPHGPNREGPRVNNYFAAATKLPLGLETEKVALAVTAGEEPHPHIGVRRWNACRSESPELIHIETVSASDGRRRRRQRGFPRPRTQRSLAFLRHLGASTEQQWFHPRLNSRLHRVHPDVVALLAEPTALDVKAIDGFECKTSNRVFPRQARDAKMLRDPLSDHVLLCQGGATAEQAGSLTHGPGSVHPLDMRTTLDPLKGKEA